MNTALPVWSTWLEWTLLLIGLGLISITEAFQLYTLLGLACLLGAYGLVAVRRGSWRLHSWIEIAGLVFLASAALAVLISYNRGLAFLQFERFVAAGVLFYIIAGRKTSQEDHRRVQSEMELRLIAIGILVIASGIALYWPLHQDYRSAAGKYFLITSFLEWIQTHLPALPGPFIDSNVAAGVLILALPLGFGLVADARQRGASLVALIETAAILLILVGLFLTGSRGAWIGLAAVAGLAGLVLVQRRWFKPGKKRMVFWIIIASVGLAAIGVFTLTGYTDRLVGRIPDPTGSLQSRTTLWSEGLDLMGDYVFTGSGLMSVPRVFAVYELLIAVPYMSHLHNLYLEVWQEQGILGEIALLSTLGIVASWAWKALSDVREPRSDFQSILGWAGLAAVMAIAVHGLVDVVFYVERTVPIVGLVFGFAHLASPSLSPAVAGQTDFQHKFLWGAAVMGSFLLLSVPFYRQVISAFYANLGAVQQTRLEMSNYNPDNFQNDSLDQVRQRLSLENVQGLLYDSLRWNPENRVALLRLGDIALSLKDETVAKTTLQTAWDAGYRDNRTRLLYGDLLVMQSQVQEAAAVQQGVPWAEWRMAGQAWYRYWVNNDYRRALAAWQTVLLLNPSNPDARYWSERAIQQLNARNP